jgi:hypothetical protein
MKRVQDWSWVFSGLLVLASPLLVGSNGATTNFGARVLAAHNRERADWSLPPLSWNEELARSAQKWADHIVRTKKFRHAPEPTHNPQGENLWSGSKGSYSAEGMVNDWLREKRFYMAGIFPANSVTGRIADVGHYTQVIWRNTTQIGCAFASGEREDILVCRYSRAGNYFGERPI